MVQHHCKLREYALVHVDNAACRRSAQVVSLLLMLPAVTIMVQPWGTRSTPQCRSLLHWAVPPPPRSKGCQTPHTEPQDYRKLRGPHAMAPLETGPPSDWGVFDKTHKVNSGPSDTSGMILQESKGSENPIWEPHLGPWNSGSSSHSKLQNGAKPHLDSAQCRSPATMQHSSEPIHPNGFVRRTHASICHEHDYAWTMHTNRRQRHQPRAHKQV